MSHITLTEEQTRVLQSAENLVEVRGAEGQLLMVYRPLTPEERAVVEEHKKRPTRLSGVPSERISALLARALQIDQTEGITEEKMAELVRQMRAGAPL